MFQGEVSFYVASCDQEANNKDTIQFYAARNLSTPYLSSLSSESDVLTDFKGVSIHKIHLTAMSIIGGPKSSIDELSTSVSSSSTIAASDVSTDSSIRPCLVCGVSVLSSVSSAPQMRTLENVWAATTDLAPSSSLVRAMNSVNSAASDSLDIMKVAGDKYSPAKSHYLVVYDFHHKAATPQPSKDDMMKNSKTKKTLSGTGTSASSTSGRQESLYQELYMSKLLYEVPVIEEVDSEMVVGAHFDGMFPSKEGGLTASSSNALYSASLGFCVQPPTSSPSPYDANFNPINGSDQFASTSDIAGMNKKATEIVKSVKADPVVQQTVCIDAHPSLRITHVTPTKDGRHLYVSLCSSAIEISTTETPQSNTNQMDIDEESEFFSSKSYMYWDQNDDPTGNKFINGDNHNDTGPTKALLLVYALDFTGKVPKIVTEPVVKRELPADAAPIETVLLPLQKKHRSLESNASPSEPRGQIALVCKDGVVRLLELSTLKIVTEARTEGEKFISAAYCSRLNRLCACTSSGGLRFFTTTEEDDSAEEKEDVEDVNMAEPGTLLKEQTAPSTSTSTVEYQEPIIAHRSNLAYTDLRSLYDLTRFDRHSPAYGATVPSCWSEMMQAQRQRRYPQHLHQSEDQHHTRTWRLQNDTTTWDEHFFEITLPRTAAGSIGHVDVQFSLHSPCLEPPTIQVTLLKQNITGLGHHKSPLTPVDERIHFNLSNEQKGENPILSEEFQRQHNTEILCGPINLKRCTDLSDHSGCVTLTSPKLFRAKARTLLVHIKALIDPAKDGAASKSRMNLLETKPPTSKKLRIDDAGPYLPGAAVERIAASASKKLECYIGCDWIHEISITVRTVQPTNIPNERVQRWAMLDSALFTETLLNVACLQGTDK